MHIRRPQFFAFFLLVFLPVALMMWWSRPGAGASGSPTMAAVPAAMISEPTGTPTAPPATATATPSQTPSPTATATALPTATPRATSTTRPTNTATPLPSATPVDRACPDPRPEKPIYNRNYLGAAPWPTPDPAGFSPHFWFGPPLRTDDAIRLNSSYPYGYDGGERYLLHNGVDIAGGLGTPVLAVADGTVVVAQDDYGELYGWRCDWYGHLLVLELDEQWQGQPVYVLYGHVLNFMVAVGDHVTQGQPVVEVGVGGAATAPHLHLEVRLGGNEFTMTRNPALWLPPRGENGVIAGRLLDPAGHPWQGVQITAAGPSTYVTWSYLDDPLHFINPDDRLAENFVVGDVRPGRYRILLTVQGVAYEAFVEVEPGRVSTVEIVTAPFKTPTPRPPATATPAQTPPPAETPVPEATSPAGDTATPEATTEPAATATPADGATAEP